jgi:subtilisin family serine protease
LYLNTGYSKLSKVLKTFERRNFKTEENIMKEGKKFYSVDGKQLPLNRVNSARFVTPAKSNLSHVGARLSRSTRLGITTEAPSNCLVVRGDVNKLEEIRHYSDVECTRSVFTDESGLELVLTNDVLVKFNDKIGDDARHELCKKMHCNVIDATDDIWRIRVLDLDDDAPLDIANKLSDEKEVVFAEPNFLQRAEYAAVTPPTDTFFPNQWHLHNTGQGGGKVGADVNALEAWEITYGSSNIRVVVHDSGVDIKHPDLKANIGPGWDFDNDDSDASNKWGPHGTACAGVIAAANNGKGVVGIAPGCKIIPLRAAGALSFSDWAKTFEWAAKNGDIISCSWGISPSNILSEAIKKVIKEGRNGKGIPVFFATGNDGPVPIGYPASLPETIAVGASSNRDLRSDYSQCGAGIDFVAPSSGGETGTRRIETTDIQGVYGYNPKAGEAGNYCKTEEDSGFGGTSSATPLAAGVAALMLSVNPALTAEQVRTIMQETAVKIAPANANYDSKGWSNYYGYGRIDAAKAVKAANALALTELELNKSVSGMLDGTDSSMMYLLKGMESGKQLNVTLDGPPDVDFDVYIKHGLEPTLDVWDGRGYTPEADEKVIVIPTKAGDYYIMVHSFKGSGSYTLLATIQTE